MIKCLQLKKLATRSLIMLKRCFSLVSSICIFGQRHMICICIHKKSGAKWSFYFPLQLSLQRSFPPNVIFFPKIQKSNLALSMKLLNSELTQITELAHHITRKYKRKTISTFSCVALCSFGGPHTRDSRGNHHFLCESSVLVNKFIKQ